MWGLGKIPQPPSREYLTNAVACAAAAHIVVLKADGAIRAWGDNTWGQCNIPPGLSNVVAVDAGGMFTVALQEDGTVITWGREDIVTNIPPNLKAVAIAAGGAHALALREDGTVASWGLGNLEVTAPRTWTNIVSISAGDYRSTGLRDDGKLWVAGDPDPFRWNPVDLQLNGNQNVVAASIGHGIITFMSSGGGVGYRTDPNDYRDRYDFNVSNKPRPVLGKPVKAIASGWFQSFALMDDGSVEAWGNNLGGIAEPTSQGIRNVIAMAPHGFYFIRRSVPPLNLPKRTRPSPAGNVVSWGGQKLPAATLTNIVQGEWDTFLRADGTVISPRLQDVTHAIKVGYDWALLENGTVISDGDCNGTSRNPPPGLTNVYDVTGGCSLTALLCDGSIVSWPYSNWPLNPEPCIAIDEGAGHMTVLRPDGTIATWGWGGNLDLEVIVPLTTPPGISNVVSMTAVEGMTAVAMADGRFAAWGITDARFQPPTGVTNAIQVVAQAILKSDGTIIDWTGDYNGDYPIPPPPGVSNVLRIGWRCAIVDGSASSATEDAAVSAESTAVTLHINTMPSVNYWITAKYNLTNEDWTNRIAFAAVLATDYWSSVQFTNLPRNAVFEISPQPIIGTPTMVNGGVTSVSLPRKLVGGYTSVPNVRVIGCGPKTNATATAVLDNGFLTGVTITNPGGPYGPCTPVVQIDPPVTTPPLSYTTTDRFTVSRLVAPGHVYQYESSTNLIDWTTATVPTVAQTNRLTLEVGVINRNAFYRLTELK